MNQKQLGIIGNDYHLTNNIFEKIISNTIAKIDQEHIKINLIYSKYNNIDDLLNKCKYLEDIGTNKILITSNISEENMKYLKNNINIDIIDMSVDFNKLIREFKNEVMHYE